MAGPPNRSIPADGPAALSDEALIPKRRRPRGSSARARCPREGREAMDTVIACAFTAVPSSTTALVAYACCVAAGSSDRREEGIE